MQLPTPLAVAEFLEITVGVEHATALWNHFVARADIAHQPLRTRVSSLLNAMWACSSHHFAALLAQKGGDVKFYTFNHEPSYTSRSAGGRLQGGCAGSGITSIRAR